MSIRFKRAVDKAKKEKGEYWVFAETRTTRLKF